MKQDVQNRFEKSTPEELLGEIIPEGGIDSEFYTEIIKLLNEAAYFRREKLDQLLQTQREEIVREIREWGKMLEGGANEWLVDDVVEALTPEPEREAE